MGIANSRIKGLDGLRALSMTLVFLGHKSMLGHVLNLGVGLLLFFVLSGYLITRILLGRRAEIERGAVAKEGELLRFFFSRGCRIFPAYYVMLAGATLLSLGGLKQIDLSWMPYYATYTTNVAIQFLSTTWPALGHLWSLAVEEQFYLISAPLFLLLPSRYAKTIAQMLVGLAIAVFVVKLSLHASVVSQISDSFVNFGALACGSLLAMGRLPENGTRSTPIAIGMVGLVICAAGALWLDPRLKDPLAMTLQRVAIPYAVLVVWGILANQESAVTRAFESRHIVFLGKISYAFYLWHEVVDLAFLTPLVRSLGLGTNFEAILLLAAEYLVCVVIAYLSWRALEAPILRWRDRVIEGNAWRWRRGSNQAIDGRSGTLPAS